MAPNPLPLIDVDRLQLGMYVVLDVGWRNHPFLFGSFMLRTSEQLRQLRALGPREVRWCPKRSTTQPLPERPAEAQESAPRDAGSEVAERALTPALLAARARWTGIKPATELQWQETLLAQVEDEYLQASQRHQQLTRLLLQDPAGARAAAEQLGETMTRTVAECHEPAVRLLSQRVSQQPSGHEVSVAALALMLGRDCGFEGESLRELALAALLHDIGKVRIPPHLHEDHARMSPFERRAFRQHVEFGADLARTMGVPDGVVRAIAEHHERCDGGGFPAAISGEQMAPISRILAIVNRYQNLVCPQKLDAGLTPYQAMQQLYGTERTHFDALFLSRFVRIMGVYPPGTLVELTDRRMAIVIASRPGASLSPRVQIIERPDDTAPSTAIDIDAESALRVRGSINPGQLDSRWAQRSRQLARSAVYVEPQTAPEWCAWGASEAVETQVF